MEIMHPYFEVNPQKLKCSVRSYERCFVGPRPFSTLILFLVVLFTCDNFFFQLFFADKQKSAPGRKVARGRKSKATAAKVALMKIKMKAVGDKGVPDSERIHLLVALPIGHREMTKPCFFSKVP